MPSINHNLARKFLNTHWTKITQLSDQGPLVDKIADNTLKQKITQIITGPTKTYRYVLLTQILAKLANPGVDCHALQTTYDLQRGFDARSLCQEVIVPFDRENHQVLGGSNEPYVSKPVRWPGVTEDYLNHQRDKTGWQNLIDIFNVVEQSNPQEVSDIFDQVLISVFRNLSQAEITYPVPPRISLEKTMILVQRFLSESSGGRRFQAVVAALFTVIGNHFHLFDRVIVRQANVSDTSSGAVADLDCYSQDNLVFAVEVKDRDIRLADFQNKIRTISAHDVKEFLFLGNANIQRDEQTENFISNQFSAGYNLYVFQFDKFAPSLLTLLGENGRNCFLREIGNQLNSNAEYTDRNRWAELLQET